jgi:cytochrome c peroxidase
MKKLIVLILACVQIACSSQDEVATPYQFQQPKEFPVATYNFSNNPITPERFELGRALFYDVRLSSDNTVSCGSCHVHEVSFADPVHRFSVGVHNQLGTRNAPPLTNLAFRNFFMWDGGVNQLDFVPINAIESPIEMNIAIKDLVYKLNRTSDYPEKFNKAFGKDSVDSQQLLKALAQFTVMMVSDNSTYDLYRKGEVMLTEQELQGLNLFAQKCQGCHSGELFSDGYFHNNGLDASFSNDSGRARITEFEGDAGKFLIPSLRNVALTAPYMHDGRFKSLVEVLEHYSMGVKESATLDPILKQDGVLGIPLTSDEKEKIIAFLKTLTDKSFTRDLKFSDPN